MNTMPLDRLGRVSATGLRDELVRLWWSKVKGQGHCEFYISRTSWGNFFKVGASVPFSSLLNLRNA